MFSFGCREGGDGSGICLEGWVVRPVYLSYWSESYAWG